MRNGFYYFNCLDSEIQEEYTYEFNNYINLDFKQFDDIMEAEFISFESFILTSFHWRSTRNGFYYWNNLVEDYELIIQRNEKLDELGI